jgi:hypothetical protein
MFAAAGDVYSPREDCLVFSLAVKVPAARRTLDP